MNEKFEETNYRIFLLEGLLTKAENSKLGHIPKPFWFPKGQAVKQ
jgi:hypothetical protein